MLIFRVLFLSFFLLGCSVKQPSPHLTHTQITKLQNLLVTLSPNVNEYEAKDLARSSIHYSYELAKKYDVVSSPWLQNSLVNLGIKKRGLCFQWTEDLLRFLVHKNYKTLKFYAVGANIKYLNEHNALSVSAKSAGVKESVLLDAWRNSGSLYFIKIDEDKEYEWKERLHLYGVIPPIKQ